MASTIQFVDTVTASPTVRLDLNSITSGISVAADGIDLSPPPLKRAVSSNLLTDEGDTVVASAYGNRTVTLPLRLTRSTSDATATTLQLLARELNRPANVLKIQLDGMSAPVFFRTLRASDYTLRMIRLLAVNAAATLEIPARPFGIGLKQTVSPITVSNNPAGANGCFFDITGVKGDVDTPLILRRPITNAGKQTMFAVRRRGTPASMPFLLQAESMVQNTNTTTQVNDANFSGAGNNYSRTTFGTPTMQNRLHQLKFPAAATPDARGTYRVFGRIRKNGNTGPINVQLQYASASGIVADIVNPTVTVPGTNLSWLELGSVTMPQGVDPVVDGVDGAELAVEGLFIRFNAERVSGTDTLDWDCFLFMPADDRVSVVTWSPEGTPGDGDRFIVDGEHDAIYSVLNSTGELTSMGSPYFDGGLPLLTPNVTNRICFLNEVLPNTAETVWPTTWSFEPFYYPRYLFVATP